MSGKSLLVLGAAAILAGCATKPVVKDTTPLRPTAVIEKHVTSNGIRGFVPFETDETDYVRTDMRHNNSAFKGTGTFTRFLLGSHNGTRIYRLDRKLLWTLNADKEEYTECPLRGCPRPQATTGAPPAAAGQQQPQAPHEQGCTMRIARSHVTVTPTGKQQDVNGFNAAEYKIAWVITLRDKKRRTSTSTLDVDLWTTPLTQDMRRAMEMDSAYGRAFAAASGEPAGQQELMPKQAAHLIMSYLGSTLRGSDVRRFFSGGHQVRRIKGHPVRTTLTWDIRGNACAPSEKPQQTEARAQRTPTSLSGLVDMVTEHETRKAVAESAKEPLLSFTVDVRQLKVVPMHDSVFDLPAGYKRVQPE